MPLSDDAPPLATTWVMSPVLRAGERRFGRFVLESLAGRGGMGVVWRARDEVLEDTVALKFLPDQLTGDPRALADLRAEARRARRLSHPQIVRIHEFFSDDTGAAVAMEFVEGRSLAAEIAREGTLTPEQILTWLPDLAAALDYAHREVGMVHRDLKPGNVLLPTDGGVKLADFGISCGIAETATRSTQFLAGGTLAYMSPQQLFGEAPALADDIYALGALLYELVTGKPPFTGGDLSLQIRKRRPVPPSRARDADAGPLPRVWDNTIMACLAKDPRRRPRCAGDVVTALQGGPARFLRRRRSLVTAGIAVATLGILALASWTIQRTTPKVPEAVRHVEVDESLSPASPRELTGRLARRMVVRLPLAGNLENTGSEHRDPLPSGKLGWAKDRTGTVDYALRMTGRQLLELPLGDSFSLGGLSPFSLMAWVQIEEGDGSVLSIHSETGGGTMARLHVQDRHVWGELAETPGSPVTVEWGSNIADGRWQHVALVFDGTYLRLSVDGDVVAKAVFTPTGTPLAGQALFVGPTKFTAPRGVGREFLRGAIHDVRLYSRDLSVQEILGIVKMERPPRPAVASLPFPFFPWERENALAVTQGRCRQGDDWQKVVTQEFGPKARIANWSDVIAVCSRWPRLAAELAGLTSPGIVHVTHRLQRVFDGDLTYCVARVDGVPGDVLDLDQIGEDTLILTPNVFQTPVPVLAYHLPSAERFTVEPLTLAPAAGGGALVAWRRDHLALEAENRCCLRLPVDLAAPDWRASIRLDQRSGDPWMLNFAPGAQPGVARLQIEHAAAAADSRVEFAVNPAPHELVIVLWNGHIYAAVVDTNTDAWGGDAVIDSGAFAIEAITAVEVEGVVSRPEAGLTPPGQWVMW